MDAGHGTGHSGKKTPGFIQRVYARKWSFLGVFLLVFLVSLWVLTAIGFVPDMPGDDSSAQNQQATSTATTLQTSSLIVGPVAALTAGETSGTGAAVAQQTGEVPVKVTIPSLNKTVTVSNPDTTDVDTLDDYLSYGAVRYPTSAKLGAQGNVIIFGHSSYLPIVHNQAYKTFDGIQNLKQGDQIDVFSADREYVYSVETEQQENADQDYIPLTTSGYTLTLSTCDSFSTKSTRFIVTATLVGSYALGSQS